jgi:hypothetical protein
MAKPFWSTVVVLAFASSLALAQAPDKPQELKKEDPVPPATDANKPEQGGKQEPSAKIQGTDGNSAAFENGTLTAQGAPTDVDTAPSKFSTRTAADDALPTAAYRLRHLSAAQKGSIYREMGKVPATATTADGEAVIGAAVPLNLILGGLAPVPDSVTSQFPELRGLAFATLAGKLALVDPTMRIVVDVATQ